jgi:hypothetical protein
MSYIMYPMFKYGRRVGMSVLGISPYVLTLDQEDIGGKPLNSGEDRELLLNYMNQSRRFEAMGNDVFRDKYSSGIIHVMPNDTVTIYSQEYYQGYSISIQRYRDEIMKMGTPEWDR